MNFLPPHECLREELEASPELRSELEERAKDQEWGTNYAKHKLVNEDNFGKIFPAAMFVDGVPFTKRDGCLAFYTFNLVSGVRHLNGVLRRSAMCRCGCRGWCTVSAVHRMMTWSLESLARGFFPTVGCLAEDFPEKSDRFGNAGLPLGISGCLVQIKGDWAEFAHTWGFDNWRSLQYPCFLCDATVANMYDIDEWFLESPCFEHRTPESYRDIIKDMEIKVAVSQEGLADLLPYLSYDKKNTGLHGRGLLVDYERLGLIAGDRIEPSWAVPDIGCLEELVKVDTAFPLDLTFWRTTRHQGIQHNNPLMASDILGISLDTFALDLLHTLHLGILNRFVASCLWSMFAIDIFNVEESGATIAEAEI